MRSHLLIACGAVVAGACYHDHGAAPAAASAATATIVRGPDVSATIADPLGFLPLDSEVVVSLDADQVRQSPLWPQVEPILIARAGSDLAMFKAGCGFDPLVAIRGISFGMRGLTEDNPDGVLVVHGIDRDQMLACVDRLKGTDKGILVDASGAVSVRSKGDDPNRLVFQFVDASTAVGLLGPTATRERLDKVIRGGAPLRSSPAFIEMFGMIDTQGTMWSVINGTGHVFDKAAALGIKPRAMFGSLSLTDGLAMNLRLRLSTAQEAAGLVTMVQGQLGTARMFFDKLDVNGDDADVVVAVAMSSSQLQTVAGLLGSSLGP